MSTKIRIKRSSEAGAPSTLAQGELAYSGLADNGSNGGDRLYIGMGTETDGDAINHFVIGGKVFTDMLDHTKGTLTANSAIITDADNKISQLNVDNIRLDGNTISTTNTNGDLNITPNGAGKTVITNLHIGADPLSEYIYDTIGGAITSGTGITVTNSDVNNTSTISITNSGATAGTYGSSSAVPVITVNAQGQITGISTDAVAQGSTNFTIAGDTGTDTFNSGETLTFTGTDPIDTAITNNTVTISAKDATTTVKGVASFNTTNFSVTTGAVSIKTGGVPNTALVNSSVTVGTTAISLGNSSTTLAGLTSVSSTSFTGALTGNASTATTLGTARGIAISGPITGTSTDFNGSQSITIPVTSLDVGHANVTGTLAVLRGGTGVTTSTGTGANVLSDSAALTGTPTVPTAASGTNTTQIASTAFVRTEVDNARVGIDAKESVRAATTGAITLSNTQTVDGVALSVGNRVLVKNQGTASQNGIYLVASGAWTRTTDAVTGTLTPGAFVFVEEGTTNADSGWVLSTTGTITVGTTSLAFTQFSGAGQITAGNGLTKTGNTIDVGAGTGITVNVDDVALTGQALAFHNLSSNGMVARTGAGAVSARTVTGTTNRLVVTNGDGVSGNPTLDISTNYVGQSTITTVGTITTGTWNGTDIAVPDGGTGLGSVTARAIVYGNGTSAFGVTGVSAINGSFLREDATGNPFWSNQIDGGTY